MENWKIKLLEKFGSEDNVVSAWNKYVEENMETEPENIKFYPNNAENIENIISNIGWIAVICLALIVIRVSFLGMMIWM